MNVAYACKAVPSCMPHELLGFDLNDLTGTLLSIKLLNKVAEEEQEMQDKNDTNKKQKGRMDKFKRNK